MAAHPTYTLATDDESAARFRNPDKKEHMMSGTTDEIKGRTKEAVGVLTDDKELQREGKTDQAAGTSKNKLDNANDWGKDKIDDIKNKLNKHD
ncbi:MAG: CsbD family protein [Aeromicrobium sp.]